MLGQNEGEGDITTKKILIKRIAELEDENEKLRDENLQTKFSIEMLKHRFEEINMENIERIQMKVKFFRERSTIFHNFLFKNLLV